MSLNHSTVPEPIPIISNSASDKVNIPLPFPRSQASNFDGNALGHLTVTSNRSVNISSQHAGFGFGLTIPTISYVLSHHSGGIL
jgi:hypothetical protein